VVCPWLDVCTDATGHRVDIAAAEGEVLLTRGVGTAAAVRARYEGRSGSA
jgi:hypothetical protein